jgi:hypothetical protein
MTGDLRVAGITLTEILSILNDHYAKIYVYGNSYFYF